MKSTDLFNRGVFHVVSRSIANYKVFNKSSDYLRMIMAMRFYQLQDPPAKFSTFLSLKTTQKYGFDKCFEKFSQDEHRLVNIIAYCLMPTHPHFILQQLADNGISIYINRILNSYSRYFNTLHKRKGPLWESRFKHVFVEKDEQLLHFTRYIHSNPTTAGIVENPEDWPYSSYREYIDPQRSYRIVGFESILDIEPKSYQRFVNDRKDYQKKLAYIKSIIKA